MLARLLSQRLGVERHEVLAATERIAQVHLVIAEEARAQATVGGEAHAVAGLAIRVRHRRDHSDGAGRITETMVFRGTIPARRRARWLQWAEASEAVEYLIARDRSEERRVG